jgi:predicted metal-dependent hydrolase
MTVRRVPFAYRRDKALHWNAGKPEFSHIVNAASLAMPYLEPYLIKTMREARPLIADALLVRDLDLYCAQESAHYRQHRKFNDELKALRPETVTALEAALNLDYLRFGRERSLTFNLAYAEGFESMALAIGHMLIEEREFLFGGADSAVASLVLWHFVEEIEHKNVTFDVFKHISGSYLWRIAGLFCATGHIMWRTRLGYHALLKDDGLWRNLRSRLALAHVLWRIFKNLTPKFLRILHPAYHPSNVADPEWVRAWAAIYEASDSAAAHLDTARLAEPFPVSLPA